ncbi:hypothetical protein AYI68_g1519 [Smittium mucronatum]|uniref:Uncharacterized protein n=1 Tax=Smittium mucronatum TaxID=133383 RepID=A0A1R0H5C7_9FUNG|nr:hypothetical protein AYI68_g1519 [Smittium mucronatum]
MEIHKPKKDAKSRNVRRVEGGREVGLGAMLKRGESGQTKTRHKRIRSMVIVLAWRKNGDGRLNKTTN